MSSLDFTKLNNNGTWLSPLSVDLNGICIGIDPTIKFKIMKPGGVHVGTCEIRLSTKSGMSQQGNISIYVYPRYDRTDIVNSVLTIALQFAKEHGLVTFYVKCKKGGDIRPEDVLQFGAKAFSDVVGTEYVEGLYVIPLT